jgi:hypothetical protein
MSAAARLRCSTSRAGLFSQRTGREPRYHLAIGQSPDWAYLGESLGPLKGYPGVMWERPRRKKTRAIDPLG